MSSTLMKETAWLSKTSCCYDDDVHFYVILFCELNAEILVAIQAERMEEEIIS